MSGRLGLPSFRPNAREVFQHQGAALKGQGVSGRRDDISDTHSEAGRSQPAPPVVIYDREMICRDAKHNSSVLTRPQKHTLEVEELLPRELWVR